MFALERVNLIKDHSFEKDSEVWHTRIYGWGFPDNMTVKVSRHDDEYSYTGGYSGSGDTREEPFNPPAGNADHAYLTQGFCVRKTYADADIDSLTLNYSLYPLDGDIEKTCLCYILLYLDNGQRKSRQAFLVAADFYGCMDQCPRRRHHRFHIVRYSGFE